MPSPVEPIDDDDLLWRRIHSDHWIPDTDGVYGPSSAAFIDPSMSVDAARLVQSGDYHETMHRDAGGVAVAQFSAGYARHTHGQVVAHDPQPDNVAHSLVTGNKPRKMAREWRTASTILT
ncbi:MAG TPA: hypothetical protein VHC63_13555 [Acidimicrobiales bacterium]|nr:hypothetical protein [Acidimicrobiales bacterium]